jgi:hypothetical protein
VTCDRGLATLLVVDRPNQFPCPDHCGEANT